MNAITYVRPYIYPEQEEALFGEKRFALVEASTKAGKTVGCIIWLTEQALQGKLNQQFWWVAPSRFQAKIAYKRLKTALTPGTFSSNESDLVVTILNGAQMCFKTGEDPDKLYGEDVYAVVVDEASRCREACWIAIRSTLTATRGKARIIGNVKGRKNWFYKMCRAAEKGDPEMSYKKITSTEAVAAGVLAAEEIESARRNLPEAAFKELYLAEPSDDGGNPFGGDDAIDKCLLPSLTNKAPVSWGWDLAKSHDWTVGIALDEDGATCRCYRWQGSWRDTIRRIVDYVGECPTLVDATGVGDPVLEYLQEKDRKNIQGFKFSSGSKQQLMESLAIAIQKEEIYFVENPIAMELRIFEYEYTRTGVFYSAPEGQHDDAVCALALAWKQWRKPGVPEWIQKALGWRPPATLAIFAR